MAARELEPIEIKADPEKLTLADVVTPVFDAEMGKRLSIARMKKLWRIEDLAPKLGLNASTLTRLESGSLSIPKHAFSVSKLEDVFGEDTVKYILLNRYKASFDEHMIRSKFWNKVTRERKPRPKGEHWTHKRLKAGLPTQGYSFQGIPGAVWDIAMKLHKESQNNSDNSTQTKGAKAGPGKGKK